MLSKTAPYVIQQTLSKGKEAIRIRWQLLAASDRLFRTKQILLLRAGTGLLRAGTGAFRDSPALGIA
ncbi:MAG: hypothetical protein ACR2JE_14790 [Acidobacteriaceae bacterium]